METIMNTLPDQDLMCAQMAVSFTLSMPPADEVMIKLRHTRLNQINNLGFSWRVSDEIIYHRRAT